MKQLVTTKPVDCFLLSVFCFLFSAFCFLLSAFCFQVLIVASAMWKCHEWRIYLVQRAAAGRCDGEIEFSSSGLVPRDHLDFEVGEEFAHPVRCGRPGGSREEELEPVIPIERRQYVQQAGRRRHRVGDRQDRTFRADRRSAGGRNGQPRCPLDSLPSGRVTLPVQTGQVGREWRRAVPRVDPDAAGGFLAALTTAVAGWPRSVRTCSRGRRRDGPCRGCRRC
ncbi:hypothetical protein F8566_45345 [Actinomadura rudentiformis]|uniref:Uncharacterized protein n=1 Tax=Actinomadura rudentiformis TaxID=359158 RepID=A0A6H9Y794_9ACTN|nr:hypothetical protein F8566_45345 [Actinomadura rudentiformis]